MPSLLTFAYPLLKIATVAQKSAQLTRARWLSAKHSDAARRLLVATALLLLSGLFVPAHAQSTITLGGYVKGDWFMPVQGVTVTMNGSTIPPAVFNGTCSQGAVYYNETTTTDASGYYSFTVVPGYCAEFSFMPFQPGRIGSGASTSGAVIANNTSLNLRLGGGDRMGNAGNPHCAGVGAPVNVTNGNMYLRQADFILPNANAPLQIVRSYNSVSNRVGLFGLGWSTSYDEAITVSDDNLIRLYEPEGRATYFSRSGGIGAFIPMAADLRGQIVRNGDGSYTLTFKDGSVHQFNASGKLLWLRDRNDNQTTLAYDTGGLLTTISDSFGHAVAVGTNTNGRVLTISDGTGVIATYAYAGSLLQSVTYGDNSRFDFNYGWAGNQQVLASVTDALGHVVESHEYDSYGRATTSRRDGGVEAYTLAYLDDGETDVTDALGHLTKYFYHDDRGRNVVTQVQGVCGCGGSGQTKNATYDDKLNITSKTNALNQTTTYTYDDQGNRLTSTDALGTTTYTYNSFGEILTATDPMNGVTTFTYDAHGNPLTIRDALNNTTTLTYNTHGQMLTATDARAKVTTLAYDASGNPQQLTDAAGNITHYTFDARARLIGLTDALGHQPAYEYDPAGRLKKITRPDGSIITCTYDSGGRRTQITDPLNHTTVYAYDGANRLTSVTDAAAHQTSYGYDLMSNLTSRTDALGHVTDYEYDDFNRLKKLIYPAANTGAVRLTELLAYDAEGDVTARTDTAGRVTAYEYDTSQRLKKVTDALSQVTQYEYNARSQMTEVIDALNQHYVFTPDALGRVTSITRGGHTMSLAYDAVGNRTSRTDYNGQTTTYAYDNLNRLTQIAYPDSTSATYAYDALSRLTSATNSAGAVTFAYDTLSQMTATTDVFGRTLAYDYDLNGNRTSLSMGQRSLTYQYDALNRLTQMSEGGQSVGYSYNAVGQPLSRSLPNGVVTSYQYDQLHRLSGLLERRGTLSLGDRYYGYNAAGEIAQASENATGWPEGIDTVHSYSYDLSGRLTSVGQYNPYQQPESYSYDAVGNRTSSHQSASYQYQPLNKLTSTATGLSYSYDANGNQTAKQDSSGNWDAGWQYSWDFENRLTQVQLPAGGTVSYQYDALGRRVERTSTVSGETVQYSYDGQDVILDTNSDGSTVQYWNGPGVDNKLRLKHSVWGTYYFGQDQLGSTVLLTDASGQAAERVEYDSFGNGAASSLTRYAYTGREWDEDAGLYYYRARWYDQQQGRFLSEDPIGLEGGINLYGYVGNNPLNYIDPTGLQPNGPFNPFRDPFDVQHWILNGISNSFAQCLDAYGAGIFSQSAWTMADHRLSASDRLWAAGDFAAASGIWISGGLAFAPEAAGGASMSGGARVAGAEAMAEAGGTAAGTAGDHIVLGLERHGLEETARRVGGRHLMNDANWQTTLQNGLVNPNTRFTVSLDGVSGSSAYSQFMSAAQRGLTPGASPFNWEMGQMYRFGRQADAIFVENLGDTLVANPFAH